MTDRVGTLWGVVRPAGTGDDRRQTVVAARGEYRFPFAQSSQPVPSPRACGTTGRRWSRYWKARGLRSPRLKTTARFPSQKVSTVGAPIRQETSPRLIADGSRLGRRLGRVGTASAEQRVRQQNSGRTTARLRKQDREALTNPLGGLGKERLLKLFQKQMDARKGVREDAESGGRSESTWRAQNNCY